MGFLTAKYDREKDLAVKRQEAYEDGLMEWRMAVCVELCQKCGKTKEDAAVFFSETLSESGEACAETYREMLEMIWDLCRPKKAQMRAFFFFGKYRLQTVSEYVRIK